MDQSKEYIFGLDSRIDINEVITVNKNEKKKVARRRWAILAKALKSPVGSEPSSPTDEFSVRRISSFMLLRTQQLPSLPLNSQDPHVIDQISKRTWADYWVSQNRKYCDFCKCWITDNRPSVDFHEKGRRHQENVKKRLRNISKHSSQAQKDSDRVDATIKQMESAALEAYRKDIESGADLTSAALNKKLKDGNLALSGPSNAGTVQKLWNEAKSKDGRVHYVNVVTNEIVYQAPKEGFMSLKEQREMVDLEARKQFIALEKYKRKEALMTMQQVEQEEAEERARLAREKLKERRVVDDIPPVTYGPLIEPGPNDPYGKWQTVTEVEVPDLQLPQQEQYIEVPVDLEPEPIVKEFKEKTIESLGEGVTGFKKRKIGSGAKRNTRQRLDDD